MHKQRLMENPIAPDSDSKPGVSSRPHSWVLGKARNTRNVPDFVEEKGGMKRLPRADSPCGSPQHR